MLLVSAVLFAGYAAVSGAEAAASGEKGKPAKALQLVYWFMSVFGGARMVVALYAGFSGGGLAEGAEWFSLGGWAFAGAALVTAAFMLLVCHTLPRYLAQRFEKAISLVFTPIGRFLALVLTPLLAPLGFISGALSKVIGNAPQDTENATEEEIRKLVIAGGERGSIEETEKEMINNVFEFNNTSVDEILVHRRDIFALSINAGLNETMRAAAVERYTRIPVYADNIDNIVGILYIKDLLKVLMEETMDENDFDLSRILHKPYFVPLSKTIDDLFNEMKKEKVHIAIVVDEYGGTAGLVTMEDLVEEVMGSILDEYDEEEKPLISLIASNTYEVNGTTELDEVAEFFECPLPVDDYDTLSGFLIGQLGRIPADGEQPQLEYEGLLFKVFKIEDRRISVVIVCKL